MKIFPLKRGRISKTSSGGQVTLILMSNETPLAIEFSTHFGRRGKLELDRVELINLLVEVRDAFREKDINLILERIK